MEWKNKKHSIGLDIGQDQIKAVELRWNGKGIPKIIQQESLFCRGLGVLDDRELDEEIGNWASEHKFIGMNTCIGIPQYLTTPQITDFPVNVNGKAMDRMVGYETKQLAGISEDTFLWDYQILKPDFEWVNPALIGVCRENVIQEKRNGLFAHGLNIQDVGMNGLALANAFFYLKPEEKKSSNVQLLLDIGVENSTLVIIGNGQVLYVSSLMFGAESFLKILKEEKKCDTAQAEKFLKDFLPVWDAEESSFVKALQTLKFELGMNLEHWRESRPSHFDALQIKHIWMSGGCAKLSGLADYLSEFYQCEVQLFQQQETSSMPAVSSDRMIALGLALQGIGAADYTVSLVPELLQWQQIRIQHFKSLFLAMFLLFVSTAAGMFFVWNHWEKEKTDVGAYISRLNKCNRIIPQLDRTIDEMEFYQKILIPITEAGLRSNVFLQTFQEFNRVQPEEDWCVYIADEFSHEANITEDNLKKKVKAPPKKNAIWGSAEIFQGDKAEENLNITPVLETELLTKMIVAGFTCPTGKGRYENILKIQNALNKGSVFSGVDWLDMNTEASGKEEAIFRPWRAYLNKQQRLLRTDFTMFILKLPLKKRNVNLSGAGKGRPKK